MTQRRLPLFASLFLLTIMFVVLAAGFGLVLAQEEGPVPGARPTPTPDGSLPSLVYPEGPESPAAPEIPPLPDLVVESIEVVPASPVIGQEVIIRVTIKNQGTVDVTPGNNFWSDLYIDPAEVPISLGQDGEAEWPCQSTWVPAGGSYILVTTQTFDDVKTYSLWAQVDTDNHVQEANENNNVRGPVSVEVLARDKIVHETHQEFQLGMASSLDLSHPEGVIRLGIFREPTTEPEVYAPDTQIDHPPEPPSGPTAVNQTYPALASDGADTLFAVWEDGRNGGVFNRDIYFSRATTDGSTWTWQEPDIDVNNNLGAGNQLRPDLAYDPTIGRLYAVWQDERDGDYDIWFAYLEDPSTVAWPPIWQGHKPLNDDVGSAAQLNPSIASGPNGEIYVVWQDQRNGNDDVYLTRSDNGGETWSANYFVTDDPEMTSQNQVAPSVIVENMEGRVIVSWEDWRDPLHPEIYTMWSKDRGATFGIDVPITIVAPEARDTYRRAPTLATETTLETIIYTYTTPVYPGLILTDTKVTSMTVIHLAWEEWLDGREDQADVYYTHANYIFNRELRETCPYPYQDEDDFCFKAPQRISGHFMDSAYVRPPGDSPQWPVEPSWQGQVSMALVPAGVHTTYCHADSTEDYSRGVVLAWADARSFDEWRYEIHTRRIASPVDNPEVFEPCEDWAWGMVNDNAKIYALRDDPDLYEIYKPAATGQFNPAVLVDPDKVIVAWDDDRYDDPTKPGTVRNRDVFMAEMDRNMEGIFISPVLDGRKADPKWYVLSWWGVTEHSSDVLFQTRFGDKDYPNPPQVGTASDGWTAWTGNPSSTYLGCLAGEGCYYDAPGRHIVRPDGTNWFTDPNGTQYRYMQYKIIMNGQSRLTAVSQVTIHYEGAGRLYLPMILRNP